MKEGGSQSVQAQGQQLNTSSTRQLAAHHRAPRLTSGHHPPLCTTRLCNVWSDFTTLPTSAARPGHSLLLKEGAYQAGEASHNSANSAAPAMAAHQACHAELLPLPQIQCSARLSYCHHSRAHVPVESTFYAVTGGPVAGNTLSSYLHISSHPLALTNLLHILLTTLFKTAPHSLPHGTVSAAFLLPLTQR